jgi:predicted dehydrogenase
MKALDHAFSSSLVFQGIRWFGIAEETAMRKPIRWGILGAGQVARGFAQGLSVLPDAELAGVTSRTAATSKEFARQFPAKRLYSTSEELASDPNIDVVYIATPHHRHFEDSKLCIEYGKPVLCEKPFTVNAREAESIIEMARRQQVFCMEAMWMRCMPLIRKTRELVKEGVIGDIRIILADFGIANQYDPNSRLFNPSNAGGALLDRGVYAISLATMLLGQPDTISSQAGMATTGVDEQSAMVLHYPRGQLAVLAASLSGNTTNSATIVGTRGRIVIPEPFFSPREIRLSRYTPASLIPTHHHSLKQRIVSTAKRSPIIHTALSIVRPLLRKEERIKLPFHGNGYNYEASEVMRCLRTGESESALMPLDETLLVMKTMDTIRAQWGLVYPGER